MQDEKILLELARLILPSGFIENFWQGGQIKMIFELLLSH